MSEKKPLGREGILASKSNIKYKIVEVEGTGPIRIREFDYVTGVRIRKYRETPNFDLAYFVESVVDEDGRQIFKESDFAEVELIPISIIHKVVSEAVEWAKVITDEEIKKSTASPIPDSLTV